jgi:hypothetical protein
MDSVSALSTICEYSDSRYAGIFARLQAVVCMCACGPRSRLGLHLRLARIRRRLGMSDGAGLADHPKVPMYVFLFRVLPQYLSLSLFLCSLLVAI